MLRFFICLTIGLITLGLTLCPADACAAEQASQLAFAAFQTEAPETDEEETEEEADEESEDKSSSADEDDDQSTDDDDKDDDKKDEKKEDKKKDDSKDDSEESDNGPKPHQVERKPLKIEAEVDAVFVANETAEVSLRPETWSSFKVLKAVKHGSQVKKGDVLVRFDDEKIEKELAEEMLDQQLGELAMMRAEEEFPREKKLMELKFETAKRKHEELLEDYQYYQSTDRPFFLEITNYRFQEAKESLASQEEELDQLEKMYEADELTEETEAIVLRRQRFEVETARLIMKLQTADRDHALQVQLPRRDTLYADLLVEAELELKQSKTAKENGITRGRYELEKKRAARATSVERHSKLVSDSSLMELRAPADGTVYYGKCVDGKWSEVASYTTKLQPFGTVTPNKVLMTIVQQRPLAVRAVLTEKELPDFQNGLPATLVPAGDKDLELSGKVLEVSKIPGSNKKFVALLEVDTAQAPEWLVAGMTCKANVTIYENPKAIVIPIKLVQTDEDDKKIKYVMLVDPKEEKPVRRNVTLGREKEKLVEVLKGLDEGDQIVKEEKKEKE